MEYQQPTPRQAVLQIRAIHPTWSPQNYLEYLAEKGYDITAIGGDRLATIEEWTGEHLTAPGAAAFDLHYESEARALHDTLLLLVGRQATIAGRDDRDPDPRGRGGYGFSGRVHAVSTVRQCLPKDHDTCLLIFVEFVNDGEHYLLGLRGRIKLRWSE
ncbi:hypothetical protein ACQEVF_58060 [Nonomuraea polychroma]|uniref:hypothetical protein n=1 Tax=Nonomuraea polychroma TaxID=46176 RepID=UPI003D91B700